MNSKVETMRRRGVCHQPTSKNQVRMKQEERREREGRKEETEGGDDEDQTSQKLSPLSSEEKMLSSGEERILSPKEEREKRKEGEKEEMNEEEEKKKEGEEEEGNFLPDSIFGIETSRKHHLLQSFQEILYPDKFKANLFRSRSHRSSDNRSSISGQLNGQELVRGENRLPMEAQSKKRSLRKEIESRIRKLVIRKKRSSPHPPFVDGNFTTIPPRLVDNPSTLRSDQLSKTTTICTIVTNTENLRPKQKIESQLSKSQIPENRNPEHQNPESRNPEHRNLDIRNLESNPDQKITLITREVINQVVNPISNQAINPISNQVINPISNQGAISETSSSASTCSYRSSASTSEASVSNASSSNARSSNHSSSTASTSNASTSNGIKDSGFDDDREGLSTLTSPTNGSSTSEKSTSERSTHLVLSLEKDTHGELGIYVSGIREGNVMKYYVSDLEPGSVARRNGRIEVGDEVIAVNGNHLRGLSLSKALELLKTDDQRVQLVIAKTPSDEKDDSRPISHHVTNNKRAPGSKIPRIIRQNSLPSLASNSSVELTPSGGRTDKHQMVSNGNNLIEGVVDELPKVKAPKAACKNLAPEKIDSVTFIKGPGQKPLGFSVVGPLPEMGIIVKSIYDGGQCVDSKLKSGDELISINGTSVEGLSHQQVLGLFKSVKIGELVIKFRSRDKANIPTTEL